MIKLILGFIIGAIYIDTFRPNIEFIIKGDTTLVQDLIDRRKYNFDICFRHPREQIKDQDHYCSIYNELDVILHDLKDRSNK